MNIDQIMVSILGSIVGALAFAFLTFVSQPIWRQVPTHVRLWWTERKDRRAHVAATRLSLQDSALRRGCLVVAKLRSEPSRDWHDPPAEVQGIWHGKQVVALPSPLRYETWGGTPEPVQPWWVPLCIPGLRVEPEWREATHVRIDPFWRPLKHHVVTKFLLDAAGKIFVCTVVAGRKSGGFLLNCPAYDQYLRNEWPYYKGLEAAFAVNALYRQKHLQDMSDRQLKDFVLPNLPTLLDKPTIQRVPRQYRPALQSRSLDAEAAYLALRGLIERYKRSGMEPLAT